MVEDYNQPKSIRVAYYIRVSTEDQVDKYGVDAQKKSLDAIVESRGVLDDKVTPVMQLAGNDYIYKDEGISGTLPLEERPAFAKLQEDIENAPDGEKPFDVVAVNKIDRFARKLKILLDVIEFFNNHDIKFISVHESIDTASPFGRAILGIVGVLAELELETIKERTLAGKKVAIERGVYMGGTAPYGYTKNAEKKLEIQETEADNVRTVFRKFVDEQESINSICTYLSENRIESPGVSAIKNNKRKGKINKRNDLFFWRPDIVKKLLGNEIYIGNYYYDKTRSKKALPKEEWKLSPHRHKHIIDVFTFKKAQILLNERKQFRTPPKESRYVYLLSGLLKCSCCYDKELDGYHGMQTWHGESKEIGKGTGKYSHYYKCRRKIADKSSIRCKSLPLPADQIEKYIVDRINELLHDPKTVFDYQNKLKSTNIHKRQVNKAYDLVRKRLNAIPERKHNLKDQHEHGIINIKELEKGLKEIEFAEKKYSDELRSIEIKLSKIKLDENYLKVFDTFEKKYKSVLENINENREEIQKVIRMIVDKIVVSTRPLREDDVIAGRRSEGQEIPHEINIYLKLPQEYLTAWENDINLESKEFGEDTFVW